MGVIVALIHGVVMLLIAYGLSYPLERVIYYTMVKPANWLQRNAQYWRDFNREFDKHGG